MDTSDKSNNLNRLGEENLLNRLYSLFYYTLKKKDIPTNLCLIFLVIESIQLISYAFSDPHMAIWGLSAESSKNLNTIIGASRITPLMTLVSFNLYLIIFFVIVAITFIYMLLLLTALRINNIASSFYRLLIGLNRGFACILQIFLMIPFSEFMLTMIKCGSNSQINLFSDSVTCWQGTHTLYAIIGIVAAIIFFLLILVTTIFYFDPFNFKKTPTKIDASADTFLFVLKAIAVLRYAVIGNDWVSIIIMLILSILNFRKAYEHTTYSNVILENIITIRNALVLWTYFVLLLAKIFQGTNFTGSIYLLIIGAPVVLIYSIYYFKLKFKTNIMTNSSFSNADEYILQIRILRNFIDAFIKFGDKSSKSSKSSQMTKDEIFLMGYITTHEETCINMSCPLKKFLEDKGNYSLQKMSLLQYVTQLYAEGIKKFPSSKALIINLVHFNYEMKINLADVKISIAKLEKSSNSLAESYVLYMIKQNLSSAASDGKLKRSMSNEEDSLRIEDTVELKFKRFKQLIETASKIYSEFWGNLSFNSSSSLNLTRFFSFGSRLTSTLREIDQLWELDLKNKKIDYDNQGIIQLYATFLRDIIKNRKKSEDLTKKLNSERFNQTKKEEGDYLNYDTLDAILENQEPVIYARANDKGQVFIVQLSNSVVALTGFSKQDAIGAPAEALMPSIYQADHAEMIAKSIKRMRINMNTNREALKAALEKRIVFVLPKSKIGYIVPINTRFGIYNDDDFANNFIIKVKMEYRDTKSVYAYYILCAEDLMVDSISSSCLNLGISNETLKKYIVNLGLLVRTVDDEPMDIVGRIEEFIEEPKPVIFVRPDEIYPKGVVVDFYSKTEEEKTKILAESKRLNLGMLSVKFQFRPDKILGFGFRFTTLEAKANKEGQDIRLAFKNQYSIDYDINTFNYSRTNLVTQKKVSGFSQREAYKSKKSIRNLSKLKTKNNNASKREGSHRDSLVDEELEKDNIITKEFITELFSLNKNQIKEEINNLHWFGNDVVYYKRDTELKNPYEDHYLKSSMIKLIMDEFTKGIEKKMEKVEKVEDTNNANDIKLEKASDFPSLDASSALNNVFSSKSADYFSIFSLFMFLSIIGIIVIEFFISNGIINDLNSKMTQSEKGFEILNSLLYTKFFLTEAMLAQNTSYANVDSYYGGNYTQYIIDQMAEMSYYRETISNAATQFANSQSNLAVTVRSLSNGQPITITIPLSEALSRVQTSIFYVANVNNNYNQINMRNVNSYELMMNLMNDYFLVWNEYNVNLINDFKTNTVPDNRLLIVFIVSFFISIISFFCVKFLFNKFLDERERPVDLFLTLKKQKFEEMRSSAENFLNQLLNKFFGNEESEEEQAVDNTLKIKGDDIMIAKFKQRTNYKYSVRNTVEYFYTFLKIFIFFLIFQLYMTFKYIMNISNLNTMSNFVDIFNVTEYSQTSILYHCNVVKQYFIDPKIPIFNQTDTLNALSENVLTISDYQEVMLSRTYTNGPNTDSVYVTDFVNLMNTDISTLINTTNVGLEIYQKTNNYGFKSVILRYFEMIRFVTISYWNDPKGDYINSPDFLFINNVVKNVVRNWYNNIITRIMTSFTGIVSQANVINSTSFIVLLVVIVIIYVLVWKAFEDNMKTLLSTSVNMINLIPESIKSVILTRLNEEDDKK